MGFKHKVKKTQKMEKGFAIFALWFQAGFGGIIHIDSDKGQ